MIFHVSKEPVGELDQYSSPFMEYLDILWYSVLLEWDITCISFKSPV